MRRKLWLIFYPLHCVLLWAWGMLPLHRRWPALYWRLLLDPPPTGEQPLRLFLGFKAWKHAYIPHYFPGEECRFLRIQRRPGWCLRPYFRHLPDAKLVIWSFKEHPSLPALLKSLGIPLSRMEDGFIRSVGLGASHALPYSQVVDPVGLYFDARHPSALENLLNKGEITAEECRRAQACIERLLAAKLSKYNPPCATPLTQDTSERRTILVIGQVEDDASILYGAGGGTDNNTLVRLAAAEHPGARILYKPHPDVLQGFRAALSNPQDVVSIAEVLDAQVYLDNALAVAEHVYTLTSLAGFEALWRGKKVTCVGTPFYAGWGLTDDRTPCLRRTRTRNLQEVFAAAYLRYATYRDPISGEAMPLEAVIERLIAERGAA